MVRTFATVSSLVLNLNLLMKYTFLQSRSSAVIFAVQLMFIFVGAAAPR